MRIRAFWTFLLSGFYFCAYGQTQLIVNGGFETVSQGEWVISGTGASQKSSPGFQHSGAAYLGLGNATIVNQSAFQTIFIPTNTVVAALSYFYDVFSGAI